MITKVGFVFRRTLPGTEYDYEILYAEDVASETEEPKTIQQRFDAVIKACTENTTRARMQQGK